MDDLEVNPLHKAFLTKFRREFEIACRMSYVVAIPHSSSLESVTLDQFFANSHILVPSKLLKMHFNQLQVGNFEDIELDERRLVCHLTPSGAPALVARILDEEVGYNSLNKECRTLLIDRPLMRPAGAEAKIVRAAASFRAILAPLSPRSQLLAQLARRQRAQLVSARSLAHHDDCAKYLDCISRTLTMELERDVRRLQTNYIILPPYLEDAAARARAIVDTHAARFERALEQGHASIRWLCDSIRRPIRTAVENHVAHLLHGKLIGATRARHEREDAALAGEKFALLAGGKLTLCQLGGQADFAHFSPSEELLQLLARLPHLKSPLAMVSCLLKLMDLIGAALGQSVELRRLLGQDGELRPPGAHKPTPICSDDLIACLVFCIPRARPANLFSLVRFLELFGWSAVERDRPAYCLATLEAAVEYILHFGERQQTRTWPRARPQNQPAETRDERAQR